VRVRPFRNSIIDLNGFNGVVTERVGSDAAVAMIALTEDNIARPAREANRLAMHAGRKTIKEEDVELAARSV
jgi:DNA-binding protein